MRCVHVRLWSVCTWGVLCVLCLCEFYVSVRAQAVCVVCVCTSACGMHVPGVFRVCCVCVSFVSVCVPELCV